MYQTILQASNQTKAIPVQDQSGVITHIELSYYEMVCIEIALIGFAECIREDNRPAVLAGFSLAHLSAQFDYLNVWLNQPDLRSSMRLDGANSVLWPLTSSELVDWLWRICQCCIHEDAIITMAGDSSCLSYYRDIVTKCETTLIRKLDAMRTQGYPLFPCFTQLN